ncbi:MAG: DUF2254 family protein [Rubrivivax sp.]
MIAYASPTRQDVCTNASDEAFRPPLLDQPPSYPRHAHRAGILVCPNLMVLVGILGAVGLVSLDRCGLVPDMLIQSAWLYNGGGTGARTLLDTVAASAIGVAGTVFSITIAALSLAAGQMGPRLLRNFTQDRGNPFTLGAFLGTFSYALMVLRSVRMQDEGLGEFVPHLALSVGILLAFLCVGTLVYFVNHMAGRIDVDTVIELVSDEVRDSIKRLGSTEPTTGRMPRLVSHAAGLVADPWWTARPKPSAARSPSALNAPAVTTSNTLCVNSSKWRFAHSLPASTTHSLR